MISALKSIIEFYLPSFPRTIVYMLQSTEYKVKPYIQWFWRTKYLKDVMRRRTLQPTKAARALLLVMWIGITVEVLIGAWLIYYARLQNSPGFLEFGIAVVIATPVVWAYLITVPLIIGRILIINPKERRLIAQSEKIFSSHKGIKIAVAGSYGKTSMKEILLTVLSQGKKVAATPANMNVPISHARFASTLTGEEDIVIIEYGEGAPGDVAKFCQTTHPQYGVITGLAPAHLDQYKTLHAAGNDIFSLASYLKNKNVYVNKESVAITPFIKKSHILYGQDGVGDWKVSSVKVDIDGTRFNLSNRSTTLQLHSRLLGRHQIGPLAIAAALAYELGLDKDGIEKGVSLTEPYEHRMQAYLLAGAWVIDDTYNGNIEGIRAGTKLLSELKAKRKIYITPGLVDQGKDSSHIHNEMGKLIAEAKPDLVVLMENSARKHIQKGLESAGYKGSVQVEHDPLEFYTNLSQILAVGDVVLMQNDWTDNYA